GTFYFHFAKKEEILLEIGTETSVSVYEVVLRALTKGGSIDEVMDEAMASMARKVGRGSRGAVRRMLGVNTAPRTDVANQSVASEGNPLHMAFAIAFTHAQAAREIPPQVDPAQLGRAMIALCMEAIGYWSSVPEVTTSELSAALQRYGRVLLAGARA